MPVAAEHRLHAVSLPQCPYVLFTWTAALLSLISGAPYMRCEPWCNAWTCGQDNCYGCDQCNAKFQQPQTPQSHTEQQMLQQAKLQAQQRPQPQAQQRPQPQGHHLTSEMCHDMLRDDGHVFRRMWAADAWAKMSPGRPPCWEVQRDQPVAQSAQTFFTETQNGQHCATNWYEGNKGWLGERSRTPGSGPALLGFDEAIDAMCRQGGQGNHAERCVNAHYNILSLYGQRVPYNICRNLEWQVCAAQGRLPGQYSRKIVFGYAPSHLDPLGSGGKPLGQCRGWTPSHVAGGEFGYATDDIFYLEVCMFSQMCTNGEDIFNLQLGDVFECQFSPQLFSELAHILQTPAAPEHGSSCRRGMDTPATKVQGWKPGSERRTAFCGDWCRAETHCTGNDPACNDCDFCRNLRAG